MFIHTYSRKVLTAAKSRDARTILTNLLVITFLAAGAAWCDSISTVTTPSGLSQNDSFSWSQIGSDQTAVQATFSVQTAGGKTVGVALTGPNSIASVVCTASPCSWTGAGFPNAGDTVLWTSDAGNGGTGPVTLTFSAPTFGAGAYIQSDMPGGFTAIATAYNSQGTALGSGSIVSNGNATYVGVLDTNGPNIASVVFSISCTNGCNTADFAVDTVGINFSTTGAPTATLSPALESFGAVPVGSSTTQPATLTNNGPSSLAISSIAASPSSDFSIQNNNCGSSLSVGAQCTINVTFKPSTTGTRNGTLTVNDNASNSPQTISLTGIGGGLQFVPVTPCRIADTRTGQGFSGQFGPPEIGAQATRNFPIAGSCGIPANALAYSLNVTVVPDASLAYLTVWPTGQAQPTVSTLNSDGRIKANAAIVPAGTNGQMSVFAYNSTNFIIDTDGYFIAAGTSGALSFYPVTPCRLVDTRNGAGSSQGPFISGNSSRSFAIRGATNSCTSTIPSSAQAYSLNFTAIPQSGNPLIYITVWPTGQSQPTVSTLNATTGTYTANAAIVPGNGSAGAVSVFASNNTDLLIDVNGYFAAPGGTGALSLYTLTPCRVLDTRGPNFNQSPFSGTLPVSVAGSSCSVPGTAQGYVLNATVVPPGQLVYLSLWPDGQSQPVVSTLNALDGAVTSDMAIVPSTDGLVDAFASNPTHLILDISSYFAP